MALNFELKKSGFPITIGGIEFFFETSGEKVTEYIERYENNLEELNNSEKELASLEDFSGKDIEQNGDSKKLSKQIEEAIALTKKVAKLEYDTLLGEGSFDKIYETFKDVTELRVAFIVIEEAVSDAIIADANKRSDDISKKRAEIFKKKNKKTKKSSK